MENKNYSYKINSTVYILKAHWAKSYRFLVKKKDIEINIRLSIEEMDKIIEFINKVKNEHS